MIVGLLARDKVLHLGVRKATQRRRATYQIVFPTQLMSNTVAYHICLPSVQRVANEFLDFCWQIFEAVVLCDVLLDFLLSLSDLIPKVYLHSVTEIIPFVKQWCTKVTQLFHKNHVNWLVQA